jgi:hypothetical protein
VARVVFLLLILANLVFFVWAQGYLGGTEDAGREPARLQAQIQPERLNVKHPDAAPPSVPQAAAAASTVVASVCRRVGPLTAADADKLKKSLLAKGIAVTANAVEEYSYWVYIPPLGGKDALDKKTQELKQLGVADFFIVNDDGANRGAISLGLFHQESAAKELIQLLAKKGVRTAKIGTKVRKTDKALLDVRGAQELLDASLAGEAGQTVACPAE